MTDQERFQAFLDGAGWKCKTFPSDKITELPMGSPNEIHYITHDTTICFSYCDLYFREGTFVAARRCGGRKDEHETTKGTQ